MNGDFTLADMIEGETAFVLRSETAGGMRKRFLDIGLSPGTAVTCVGASPPGDPKAYRILSAVIAIRRKDAKTVIMTKTEGYR